MPNVPTTTPGPDDTEHTPEDVTETIPLITNVHADKQSGRANDATEISDEEAYAKLKAKRAERRRKKLIRRGIAAGVVGTIALIAIVATLVINAQPQGASGPVTDMVTEGPFTTTVEAKGQLKPISSSVVSPSVDGTVDSINVQAGQSVNEGDVLMTIKNDELDRNVAEAQRAVAAAQEDLANAQKAAAAAQATPTTDVDGASAAAGVSDASTDTNAVSAAQRSLASAQANLDQANAKAGSRTVTAPSSGSIVELNAKVGATVTGGMIMGESDTSGGKQCMQIADLSKMKVTVQVGEKDMYLLHHEELESLALNIKGIKRIRFFMTFGQSYLTPLKCLEDVGMTSIEPIDFEGKKIVPLQFLKAVLPDPASLGPRTKGKTNIGCIFQGKKDGKDKTYYIYNVCDHQECYREVGSQAISYTTGVPAMCGALMMLTGEWTKPGVYTVEEFNPDPFLDALDKYGLPRSENHDPVLVD